MQSIFSIYDYFIQYFLQDRGSWCCLSQISEQGERMVFFYNFDFSDKNLFTSAPNSRIKKKCILGCKNQHVFRVNAVFSLIFVIFSMEELGDQIKVVFAWLLLESAGKWGGGGGQRGAGTPGPPPHTQGGIRNKLCKDDFTLVSWFLHGHSHSFKEMISLFTVMVIFI